MARFKDNNLSGAVGNLIFYTRDGENFVRSKPGKRKRKRGQAPDTNTTIFGKVSSNGSGMLKLLGRHLLFSFGLRSYNNGRGWMRNHYAANYNLPQWDINARPNDMCQLNPASDLRDMFFTSIFINDTGSGKLLVTIPAMNPVKDMKKLPAQITDVNIKLAVLYSRFEDSSPVYLAMEQYSFVYADMQLQAKDLIIDTKAPAGNLAIVVLAIEPVIPGKNIPVAWLPASIIAMGRLKQ
jgi:hypothetical protein